MGMRLKDLTDDELYMLFDEVVEEMNKRKAEVWRNDNIQSDKLD